MGGVRTPWIVVISIHALREEGDRIEMEARMYPKNISIHALREEGDASTCRASL